MAAAPGFNRVLLFVSALVMILLLAASGCSEPTQLPPSKSDSPKAASPASGTVVTTLESTDSSEALRAYLEDWKADFNRAAVGSDVGTAPLDAAMAVPLDRHDIITLSQIVIEPAGGGPLGHSRFRVDFEFWRGNPASSSYPAEPLSSSATYDVGRDDQSGKWVITLTSAPPGRPQPTAP